MKPKKLRLPQIDTHLQPWVEPGLPDAFAGLPGQQRIVVGLLYGYQWSMTEVAEYPGLSKGTDQSTHTQEVLDQAAYSLNTRPRRTLGGMTPSDKLAEARH